VRVRDPIETRHFIVVSKFASSAIDLDGMVFGVSGNGGIEEGDMKGGRPSHPITIQCTRDPTANTYSIQAFGDDGAPIGEKKSCYEEQPMFPHIYLKGDARISNVKYF
jgi:hypothetical protein